MQGGGATAICAGSHKVMGEFLRKQEPEGCSYMRLFYQAHYVCVPCSSAARPGFCTLRFSCLPAVRSFNAVCAMGFGRSRMAVVQAAPCRAGDVLLM